MTADKIEYARKLFEWNLFWDEFIDSHSLKVVYKIFLRDRPQIFTRTRPQPFQPELFAGYEIIAYFLSKNDESAGGITPDASIRKRPSERVFFPFKEGKF